MKKIPLEHLYLDPNNYRLRSNPYFEELTEKDIFKKAVQSRTRRMISGEKNANLTELLRSILENDFLEVDAILVRKVDENKYVVVEGNRRITALRILKERFQNGGDIHNLSTDIFENGVGVTLITKKKESHLLVLMGLKHVSGNMKWDTYNQAYLVKTLIDEENHTPREVADMLGITVQATNKLFRSFNLMSNYVTYYNTEIALDEFAPYSTYQMFYELTGKKELKKWLDVDEESYTIPFSENAKRFYDWISPTIKEYDNNDEFEINGKHLKPILDNHKMLRDLNDIIEDDEVLEIMESERDFNLAIGSTDKFAKRELYNILKFVTRNLNNISNQHYNSISTDNVKELLRETNYASKMLDKLKKELDSFTDNE